MLRRHLMPVLAAAMKDRPVVLLHGPRQTGKTTLARSAVKGARYLTFDDATVAAAATGDPRGFLDGLGGPAILDEVQRVPTLFPAIKASVDEDRRPGRFLLTGSANIFMLPRLSESLAGRMEIIRLMPLSQGEIDRRDEMFVDALFKKRFSLPEPRRGGLGLSARIVRGGYPEVVANLAANRRSAWFESYISAILQRDVRDFSNIEDLTILPRLLALIASRTAGLLNFADLSRTLSLPQSTLKRYFALLEATFLVHLVPPWFSNVGKRLAKSPKVFLSDTGLAAHLVGVDRARLESDGALLGHFLENFVFAELTKHVSWSTRRPTILHFNAHSGPEVDLVLEDRSGDLVGIEVKGSAKVGSEDFRGLKALRELAGERFIRGIVLYTGREHVPFGGELHAVPLQTLWSGSSA